MGRCWALGVVDEGMGAEVAWRAPIALWRDCAILDVMDEATAREILGDMVQPSNALYAGDEYVDWSVSESGVVLDGVFGAETLEAIVWWMNNKSEEGEG